MKRTIKITGKIVLILLAALLIFSVATYIVHYVKTNEELDVLQQSGLYNPVPIGDYSLNVAKFGNENGSHTIVAMAGLGMGDCSVSMRQMTTCLEEDNLVVFVDRAGYGLSDDTNHEMTLERIVEDYRKALKNFGIEGPYILMPHSIGGAYATYWCSQYPEEIEAIVFVDGSQLSEDAFEDEAIYEVGFETKALAFLAKIGFSRFVIRDYFYHYPANYSEEEQYLGDALMYLTFDSIAPESESGLLVENGRKAFDTIVTNDIPKLYICASWGIKTKEDIIELNEWINEQIDINSLDMPKRSIEYDDKTIEEILDNFEKARQERLMPYIEKMGNCELICLGGDHMIYEQKPEECGIIIKDFIDRLNN